MKLLFWALLLFPAAVIGPLLWKIITFGAERALEGRLPPPWARAAMLLPYLLLVAAGFTGLTYRTLRNDWWPLLNAMSAGLPVALVWGGAWWNLAGAWTCGFFCVDATPPGLPLLLGLWAGTTMAGGFALGGWLVARRTRSPVLGGLAIEKSN